MTSLAVQLSVLAALEEPKPTSAVSEELDVEEIEVEEAVTSLEEAGLVEREGFGAKTRLVPVVPELPRHAHDARAELSPEAWGALFVEERAELAHVLHRVTRLELAAFVLDEPVETVRGDVHDLAEAGVVTDDEDGFRLDPGLRALAELLAEIDALRARRWVQRLDPEAEVRWHLGPDVLFTAAPGIQHPDVTYGGASLFADHGVPLERSTTVYARTRRSLDASDAILQALLLDPDAEEVQAACLELYEQEPTPTFAEKARIYGLEDEAERIRRGAEAG